jgi:hypothetical protein
MEKKGYARKVEQGRVPHQYDRGSKSFKAGAHKHWTGDQYRDGKVARLDGRQLTLAREARS